MTSTIRAVTVDCDNAQTLAAFWAGVLGVAPDPDEQGTGPFFQSIGRAASNTSGPVMMFIKVPESKSVKNRMHLDLSTDDREAEVARLVELGATVVHQKDEWGISWTTLADPEGNEFCVAAD